jgi:hypothetical protein
VNSIPAARNRLATRFCPTTHQANPMAPMDEKRAAAGESVDHDRNTPV